MPNEDYGGILGKLSNTCTFPTENELSDQYCYICIRSFNQAEEAEIPTKLGCGHIFCMPCLLKWSSSSSAEGPTSPTCPVCRRPFISGESALDSQWQEQTEEISRSVLGFHYNKRCNQMLSNDEEVWIRRAERRWITFCETLVDSLSYLHCIERKSIVLDHPASVVLFESSYALAKFMLSFETGYHFYHAYRHRDADFKTNMKLFDIWEEIHRKFGVKIPDDFDRLVDHLAEADKSSMEGGLLRKWRVSRVLGIRWEDPEEIDDTGETIASELAGIETAAGGTAAEQRDRNVADTSVTDAEDAGLRHHRHINGHTLPLSDLDSDGTIMGDTDPENDPRYDEMETDSCYSESEETDTEESDSERSDVKVSDREVTGLEDAAGSQDEQRHDNQEHEQHKLVPSGRDLRLLIQMSRTWRMQQMETHSEESSSVFESMAKPYVTAEESHSDTTSTASSEVSDISDRERADLEQDLNDLGIEMDTSSDYEGVARPYVTEETDSEATTDVDGEVSSEISDREIADLEDERLAMLLDEQGSDDEESDSGDTVDEVEKMDMRGLVEMMKKHRRTFFGTIAELKRAQGSRQ